MIRLIRFLAAICAISLVCATGVAAKQYKIKNGAGGDMRVVVDGSGPRAVILAHQYRGDANEWKFFVKPLTRAGFTVLRFDFNGYGRYGGEKDRSANAKDVAQVYGLARQLGAEQIWLIGSSMGAGAVLKAGESLDTAGIIAMAPFVDNTSFATPTSASAGRIREPVLLMTAQGDNTVAHAQKLDGRLPKSQLTVYPGDAHGLALLKGRTKSQATTEVLGFLGVK